MNELSKVFRYENRQVRTSVINNEPWFVAKDICDILEIGNSRMALERIPEKMKGVSSIDTLGGKQEMAVVSEAGVYKLVFTSRKSEAEKFTDWLASDVIPSIRKHGAYMTPETLEKAILNPDFIINLAGRLKEEQIKRQEAEAKIEQQKPLVVFAEACIASKDSLLIREVAKLACKNGIEIGEKRLYQKLRDWKLIMQSKNEPYQSAMESGYFEIKVSVKQTPYGTDTYRTSVVTPRGQVYIIERLKREKQEEPIEY